jgi:hypothetical protein
VDVNAEGEHLSVSCTVTVKGLVSVAGKVNAQAVAADGTSKWVSLDLSNLTTTTLANSSVALLGGGYGDGNIYGVAGDFTNGGYIYKVDPSKNYTATAGSQCSTLWIILDGTTLPTTTLTDGEDTYTAEGEVLYVSNNQYLLILQDYEAGSLTGWNLSTAWDNLAAIAYIGYTTDDAGATVHCYAALDGDGGLYLFAVTPKVSSGTVGYSLSRSLIADLGITFSDFTALSMTYLRTDSADGLVIADASGSNTAMYYVDLSGEEVTIGKMGNVDGTINSLYSSFDVAAASATALVREGTETESSSTVSAAYDSINQTAVDAVELSLSGAATEAVANEVGGSTNAIRGSFAKLNKKAVEVAADVATSGKATVTVTEDVDVTNGRVTVTYDPEVLTYAGLTSSVAYTAVNVDEENGVIVFSYASATAIAAGSTLATVNFTYEGEEIDTTVAIATSQRNAEVALEESASVSVTVAGDQVRKYVTRCYNEILDREPDEEGLNFWCEAIRSKTYPATFVAKCFLFSEEVTEKNLSNEEFVKILYRAFMGREAEEDGLNYWVEQLENGFTREFTVDVFTGCPEFQEILKGFGLDD